jgi:galactokinase
MVDLASRLAELGFTRDEAERRAARLGPVADRMRELTPRPAQLYHVPGRIEVLGKHTDYAGGRSLVCATEQGLAVAAAVRDDASVTALDLTRSERRGFAIGPDTEPAPGDWSDYLRTVARRLARDFPGDWRGVDLVFSSDLPPAAGVSSSSALVVATMLALGDANRLSEHPRYRDALAEPEAVAGYLGAVENGRPFGAFDGGGGVGTLGGSQDQTAILCARPGRLVQYGFEPVRFEAETPLPAGLVFAVAASGVVAEKTGAALRLYNATAERTARLWQLVRDAVLERYLTLGAAVVAGDDVVDAMRRRLAERATELAERARLEARLEQLREECAELIPGLAGALARGQLDRVGELVARSQRGAERALENQIAETVALVAQARELGAIAASAFGAGFGGSVWALVRSADATHFLEGWRAGYLAAFPQRSAGARFFLTGASSPATRL